MRECILCRSMQCSCGIVEQNGQYYNAYAGQAAQLEEKVKALTRSLAMERVVDAARVVCKGPRKVRKPSGLEMKRDLRGVYADLYQEENHVVYIGGDYYQQSAQIHLTEEDVLRLAPWLNRAAEYLLAKRAKGKALPQRARKDSEGK